ncbi:hypothetical protein XELAEV_18019118mg [Xenopus laevis]|uniref:Uncharacterized protein n=1 Tax=Xenopus laevis TaxID=8355 RepID=A0A974DEC3_XENLA|nr:hypothetical protein XELAEV_18019118mg [Xenopus laevis]
MMRVLHKIRGRDVALRESEEGHRYNAGTGNHWEKGILSCRAYTLIYSRTQIQYRDREPLGEGNSVLQSLHSNIQRDTDTIQGQGTIGRREFWNHWEKRILSCIAYTLIYRGTQIQYRDREPLGEGNPALQSLHSNIQRDTDTEQREGTIGGRESCPTELTL